MKLFNVALVAIGLIVSGALFSPAVQADEWNRKTIVKFSGPVEIPGVHMPGWGVLPAGTYVFKILDSQSNRHIVQIFSEDEKTVYATILAIPNYRLQATDKTVITFRERPAGQPEALRAWFYPGRTSGEEFVYPKAKALALAKESNTPVLFVPDELPLEATAPIQTADAPVVLEMKRAPIMAVKPTGEEIQLAEVVTEPPAETQVAAAAQTSDNQAPSASQNAPTRLPDTASELPLIGLLGMGAVAGAFAIRAAASRL